MGACGSQPTPQRGKARSVAAPQTARTQTQTSRSKTEPPSGTHTHRSRSPSPSPVQKPPPQPQSQPRHVSPPPSQRRQAQTQLKQASPSPPPTAALDTGGGGGADPLSATCGTLGASLTNLNGSLNASMTNRSRRARGSGAHLLSDFEVDVFYELVKCRKDPKGYANYVQDVLDQASEVFTHPHARAAYDECIRFLREDAVPVERTPYFVSAALQRAAEFHRMDCEEHNITGHLGSEGGTLDERVSAHGRWWLAIAENICYGEGAPRGVLIRMLLDDGTATRKQRHTIFSKEMAYVGISCGIHPSQGQQCVLVFAGRVEDADRQRRE